MTVSIFGAGIIAPAIFWIVYFRYKDRYAPEPLTKIGITFILGIAAAYICNYFYELLAPVGMPADPTVLMETNPPLFLAYCLGYVGLVEEFFKMLPFIFIVVRFRDFDEKIDGIIYASIIALGFASFENFHYLAVMDGWELIGRAIASPLTHTIFASLWGYAISRARFEGGSQVKAGIVGFLLAALCHGLFDFLTLTPGLRLVSAATLLVVWIWRIRIFEGIVEELTAAGAITVLRVTTAGKRRGAVPRSGHSTMLSPTTSKY